MTEQKSTSNKVKNRNPLKFAEIHANPGTARGRRVSEIPKKWDVLMKLLAKTSPQHVVSLLLPGAQFESDFPTEQYVRVANADLFYTVIWQGKKIILHIEFQKQGDKDMDRRVWEYNAMADYIFGLPVYSVVVYLVEDDIVESPYRRKLPDGVYSQICHFRSIKLWTLPTREFSELLKKKGLHGLLPLLPLTAEGAKREVVEDMITCLHEVGRDDLSSLGLMFAELVNTLEDQVVWLQERFIAMQETFRESWIYQQIEAEGLEKGFAKGEKLGMEQGMAKGIEQGIKQEREKESEILRFLLVRLVEKQFPELSFLAGQQSRLLKMPEQLQATLDSLFSAQTLEEARGILVAASQDTTQPS